jgi:GNAT superfamily N-acetyltransferase
MNPDQQDPRSGNAQPLELQDMTVEQADDGLRLSQLAGWNQTREDWAFLLLEGKGTGFRTADGLWVATMVTLPVGPKHGWISMVLTDPDYRRRGLAGCLMIVGIERLEQSGLVPALDATPEGEKVYRSLGFTTATGLGRWLVEPKKPVSPGTSTVDKGIRLVKMDDLEALEAWDREQSGCERKEILRYLHSSRPDLAILAENSDGKIHGYIMGRDGERATQLGPLVATNPNTARQLLKVALRQAGGPVYVDAFSANQQLLKIGSGATWTLERSFTRMIPGDIGAPGNASSLFLAAGPELG